MYRSQIISHKSHGLLRYDNSNRLPDGDSNSYDLFPEAGK